MVTRMKTTVELPEELFREVQRVARDEGVSMRSLMEEGLRMVLERHRGTSRFRLADASVDGRGLHAEFQDASWDELRAAAYGDRL